MNFKSLSTRDRRAVVLGAAAFAPMLLWLLVIAPFTRRLAETHDRLDRSTELLGRELRIVRSAREYVAMRPEVQRRLADAQRHLIYATSDASARATLVGVVDERARASDVDVTSVNATADSAASGALRRVSVRLSGTGDMEGILTLIGKLEVGSPFLTVSQIEIESTGPSVDSPPTAVPMNGDSTAVRTPPMRGPERLALRLVVSGFRASTESERRPAAGPDRVAAR
jgi:type II secretory pathway component PulM